MAKPVNDQRYLEEDNFNFNAIAYIRAWGAERPVYIWKNANQRMYIVGDQLLDFIRDRCILVNKAAGTLEPGEMIMVVYDETDTPFNVYKLYDKHVYYWDATGKIKRAKWKPGVPAGDGYMTFTTP